MADIDGRGGLEIVVDTWHGASTAFAGVFSLRSGKLTQMGIEGPATGVSGGPAFAYAGSVTHQNGVDCSGRRRSGLIVASGAAGFGGKRWKVTRRFYRVQGTDFVLEPAMTEHATIPYRLNHPGNLSKRFPELAEGPFASCMKATP